VAAGLLLLVAACGGTATSSTPTSGSSSGSSAASSSASGSTAAPSSAAAIRTLRVTVSGKDVSPAPARVPLAQGERLRLVVTIDHADEIHVHGFEVEREATAGQPVTIDLTGGVPGLYEVETHHPPLRLLQILVR
jgi:hypothetical protein